MLCTCVHTCICTNVTTTYHKHNHTHSYTYMHTHIGTVIFLWAQLVCGACFSLPQLIHVSWLVDLIYMYMYTHGNHPVGQITKLGHLHGSEHGEINVTPAKKWWLDWSHVIIEKYQPYSGKIFWHYSPVATVYMYLNFCMIFGWIMPWILMLSIPSFRVDSIQILIKLDSMTSFVVGRHFFPAINLHAYKYKLMT